MKMFYFLLALVALASCKKSHTRETVLLESGSCTEAAGPGITICFDSLLEDSRCPPHALCVWQGLAKAQFSLYIGQQQHTLWLSTAELLPGYRTDTSINGFHLKLVNIYPYPGTSQPAPAPTAVIEITQ